MLEDAQIKLAVKDEGTKVIEMLKKVAQWMREQKINQWQYLLNGGDDEEILEAIKQNETFIILNDEEIIATFTLSTIQSDWDRHIFGGDTEEDSVYLHRLAVSPEHIGKGLGKELLNWIEKNFSTDKTYLKLDCVADNSKLNQFYLANGFHYLGETDHHSKYEKKFFS
ncbi:GNAT family N-acetyltransferase [Bacillus sp. ISL-55]|uniref:GNAT family N-acetyltransferase n=1 Tax=Bacillus sp. ISL-55 TaxID=2819134 RepID=UPI002570FECD|nr:GNAT family N-acetyltransferase [Bacillus sp. ISL-55]